MVVAPLRVTFFIKISAKLWKFSCSGHYLLQWTWTLGILSEAFSCSLFNTWKGCEIFSLINVKESFFYGVSKRSNLQVAIIR
jgi:hypothetical protein